VLLLVLLPVLGFLFNFTWKLNLHWISLKFYRYFQEQAAKEAIAAANKKAFEANFENCSEDLLAARELAASASEAVAKSRKVLSEYFFVTLLLLNCTTNNFR